MPQSLIIKQDSKIFLKAKTGVTSITGTGVNTLATNGKGRTEKGHHSHKLTTTQLKQDLA